MLPVRRLGASPRRGTTADRALGHSPAGRALEVNDTRMSGEEFEIRYPLSRDPSALTEQEQRKSPE